MLTDSEKNQTRERFAALPVKVLVRVMLTILNGRAYETLPKTDRKSIGYDYAKRTKADLVEHAVRLADENLSTVDALHAIIEGARIDQMSADANRTPRATTTASATAEDEKSDETSTVEVEPAPIQNGPSNDAAQLAELLRRMAGQSVDERKVRTIVGMELRDKVDVAIEDIRSAATSAAAHAAEQVLRDNLPLRVEIKKPDGTINEVDGLVHKQFPLLLQMVSANVPVWLAGPAGSGKTTAAHQVAKALGLTFYFNGAIDNEYKLLGFTDAQGRVVSRPFREAFLNGGVYLFDECDSSMPGALLAFNAALANGSCDFPDGCLPRHPEFRVIAAANTYGHGATSDYVGRVRLDGAFLDRFVVLAWDYDHKLELALSGNPDWCIYVQTLRANAKQKGVKVIISPRATIFGARLLAQGVRRSDVVAATVRKGMTNEQWSSVSQGVDND